MFTPQAGAFGRTTSLRSLRVSTYPNVADFNIPVAISQLSNLQKLWIDAPEPQKIVSGGRVTYKSVAASDLRREMMGLLPYKLRDITIGGKGFKILSESMLAVIIKKKIVTQIVNMLS